MRISNFIRWLLTNLYYSLLVRSTSASQFFTEDSAPPNLSKACVGALTADIPCSRLVPRFRYGFFYSESTLNATCIPECEEALGSYEAAVVSACERDTWEGYDDEGGAPLGYIPSILRYQYSLTCLRDRERWCNVVTGAAATVDDPGGEDISTYCLHMTLKRLTDSFSPPTDSPFRFTDIVANGTVADPCDMCFILSLRIQAGAPFYDGPAIASQSLYQSKTSSCKIQDVPLTTTSVPFSMSE